MNRGARLLAGLAALSGLVFWIDRDPGPASWIVPEPAQRVNRVQIEYQGHSVTFARGPAGWRSEAGPGVIAEGAGPGYRGVASPDSVDVPTRVEWLLAQLCRREAAMLPVPTVSGAEFGLDPPVLRLTLSAEHTYHLDVGGLPPSGSGRYFRLREPQRAGLLPRDVAGELTALAGGGPRH